MSMTSDPRQIIELARRLTRDEFLRTYNCPFLVSVDALATPAPANYDDESTAFGGMVPRPHAAAPAPAPTPTSVLMVMSVVSARPYAPEITVGRSSTNDIVIISPSVSKQHAVLIQSPSGWEVADAGSRNGTSLGTRHLGPNERALLKSGDVIAFGYAPFFFFTAMDAWGRFRVR